MLEKKFKGYDTETGEWIEFTLADLLATSEQYSTIDPDTVKQYCDGKDKDGRNVYEQDVLHLEVDGKSYDYEARLEGIAVTDRGYLLHAWQFAEKKLL